MDYRVKKQTEKSAKICDKNGWKTDVVMPPNAT